MDLMLHSTDSIVVLLQIALLNLFTISAMWARITDVMTSEVGVTTSTKFAYILR